jgi:hypothetical protein
VITSAALPWNEIEVASPEAAGLSAQGVAASSTFFGERSSPIGLSMPAARPVAGAVILGHRPGELTAAGGGGQVTKGARWMSWHREATKDVGACDKPREAGNQALIRGFLNGETRRRLIPAVTPA